MATYVVSYRLETCGVVTDMGDMILRATSKEAAISALKVELTPWRDEDVVVEKVKELVRH